MLWRFFKNNYRIIIFLFLVLSILLANTFHMEYPDEYDSIVGGQFIDQGRLPYRDWFQHHQPGAYVLASIILPFSGTSFVKFRTILAVVYFLIIIGSYLMVSRLVKQKTLPFYLLFILMVAFGGTYFWGQMLLADVLAAYFFIPAFILLLIKEAKNENYTTKDLLFISVMTFLTWFTSMSYLYLIVIVLFYVFVQYLIQGKNELRKRLIKIILIFSVPYLVFFIYLLITGSLKEYYFANIIYNSKYYIYNYPRPYGKMINPLRYCIVILNNFIINFFSPLIGIARFSVGDPLNVTLALSVVSLFIWSLLKRRFFFVLVLGIIVVFSTVRSNPGEIRETDYQSIMYILVAMAAGLFTLFQLKKNIDENKQILSQKIITILMFIILSIYWFFTAYNLSMKFWQKVYPKYMGTQALIYDRPEVAQIINQITNKQDYAWVGPFDFKELFYLKAKIPSKYHWFLDHAANIDKIKTEMIADFTKNRPKVIVFRRYYHPWGGKASDMNYFFTDFLDKNYFRIFEYNQTLADKEYKWKIGNTQEYDIDGDFYFEKGKEQETIDQLLSLNLIEAVPKLK